MTVLEGVRDYLRTYPSLETLEVDVLGTGTGAVCLHPLAEDPLQKTYLDGSSRRQLSLDLRVRQGYGGNSEVRMESLQWFFEFSRWLEDNTRSGNLPELGDGRRAWSLRAVSTASSELFQEDGLLVDQITLQLIYFESKQEE